MAAQQSSISTESGWYPSPDNPHLQRWWDGAAWTEYTLAPNQVSYYAPQPRLPEPQRSNMPLILGVIGGTVLLLMIVLIAAVALGASKTSPLSAPSVPAVPSRPALPSIPAIPTPAPSGGGGDDLYSGPLDGFTNPQSPGGDMLGGVIDQLWQSMSPEDRQQMCAMWQAIPSDAFQLFDDGSGNDLGAQQLDSFLKTHCP